MNENESSAFFFFHLEGYHDFLKTMSLYYYHLTTFRDRKDREKKHEEKRRERKRLWRPAVCSFA